MQEAIKVFKVHYNTISKWLNRYLKEGHINPKEMGKMKSICKRKSLFNTIDRILLIEKNLMYQEQDREKVEEYKKLLTELFEETSIIYPDKSFIKQ
jgi:hypothetical protein